MIIGGMFTFTLYTVAAPPLSPYITTDVALDPVCMPGAVNCFVDLSFNGWSLTGNSATVPGTNFIGTTDLQDLVFKTNNIQTGKITANGLALHFGSGAGENATLYDSSVFLGTNAGKDSTNGINSNFLGPGAGQNAIYADGSNFLGIDAGGGGVSVYYSNFIGRQAGYSASSAYQSNFIGHLAGYNADNALRSNFIGDFAGNAATSAEYSNFIGTRAGYGATNANNANFIGRFSGQGATASAYSNFIGYGSGNSATNANNSVFLGTNAGSGAVNANLSNFIGASAGLNATNANSSTFIGNNAGNSATNAASSIFIGNNSGNGSTVNTILVPGDYSILIGNDTSNAGFANSIALGSSATNTASNEFMIGSLTRPINTLVLTGAGGNTCILDVTVASPSCSSDENLKSNILPLRDTVLNDLLKTKTVTYNWKNYQDKGPQIGFIAQDLEQYFPELVTTSPNGFKTVSYGGMTPVIVEAIRELDFKITQLTPVNTTLATSFGQIIKDALSNVNNGIKEIYSSIVNADKVNTKELCVGSTCVTEDLFLQMVNSHKNTQIQNPALNTTNTVGNSQTQQTNQDTAAGAPSISQEENQIPTTNQIQETVPVESDISV